MDEKTIKFMLDLYKNPFFKQGFSEFFLKMQGEGLASARKFWENYPQKEMFFPNAPDVFEQMIELYSSMGLVTRKKYDEKIRENEELKKENQFLKDTIKELNLKVFAEEGHKAQEVWKSTIEKQLEVNKEMAKSFLELFKPEK